jgi:hypothetical protein
MVVWVEELQFGDTSSTRDQTPGDRKDFLVPRDVNTNDPSHDQPRFFMGLG